MSRRSNTSNHSPQEPVERAVTPYTHSAPFDSRQQTPASRVASGPSLPRSNQGSPSRQSRSRRESPVQADRSLEARIKLRVDSSENASFYEDPIIQVRLPYPEDFEEVYGVPEEWWTHYATPAVGHIPTAAHTISVVKTDATANEFRKVFRRLGQRIYGIAPPTVDQYYPSPNCEVWATVLFERLDRLTTFIPNCLVTQDYIPTVCVADQPEYGNFFIDLVRNRDRSLRASLEPLEAPPLPQWPYAQCYFDSTAFEVAAVVFRDEVERFIAWLYMHAPERSVYSSQNSSNASDAASEQRNTLPLLQELQEATM
jgi:hypothetical protein